MRGNQQQRLHRSGFTLAELLVSMAVLALLVLLVNQLFGSAARITTLGNKRMDAHSQSRPVFDRMQIDFARMVKRADVNYYLKSSGNLQPGNDQIAFFSEVAGYIGGTPSPLSLVAYRINSDVNAIAYQKLQRMSKGLAWNGTPGSDLPIVFLPLTINATWSEATSPSAADPDYDLYGPQVFRFEYRYLLRDGTYSVTPSIAGGGGAAVSDLQDVAAVVVAIAVIDPQSRVLATDSALASLATSMNDFDSSGAAGVLERQWQTAAMASPLPRPAASAVRVYSRTFYLGPDSKAL